MIVSHRHRFIFIKTRKTASTSVEIALSRHCGPDDVVTPITPEDEVLRARLGGLGPQNHEPPDFPVRAANHSGCRAVGAAVGCAVWNDYFTFAVERNPWDAVVSSYHYRFRHRLRSRSPTSCWAAWPTSSPSAKSGFRDPRDYRSFYGTREREYVARLFRRTIRDFGYEF